MVAATRLPPTAAGSAAYDLDLTEHTTQARVARQRLMKLVERSRFASEHAVDAFSCHEDRAGQAPGELAQDTDDMWDVCHVCELVERVVKDRGARVTV